MPDGSIIDGNGDSNLDPIVPALSKNYTYQTVVDLVRLLSHTSGNTTVITAGEILEIVKDVVGQVGRENWKAIAPYHLQTNTMNISGTSNFYKSYYSTFNPYVHTFIGAIFLQGTTRRPIVTQKMVNGVYVPLTAKDLDDMAKMSTTYANSILGTLYDGHIEMFVGSSVVTTPNEYQTEIYYFRQPQLNGITTTNYSTVYVDLPDSFIPEVLDRSVFQVERTKQ